MVVNGLAPPPGVPATKKVKHGDLGAAYDLCKRQGTPATFRGPYCVPGYTCCVVGTTLSSRPSAPKPDEPDEPEPPVLDSSGPDSDDANSDDDDDVPSAGERGGSNQPDKIRLADGASPPPGSRHVSTSADGSKTYINQW